MTFRDLIDLSVGNLWRIKLRAFLTVAGVVIAVATLVAMLSFAAGNHKHVSRSFQELGLLTKMNVYPAFSQGAQRGDSATDTTETVVLNREAIRKLAQIPGVKLAYPFEDFTVTATVADTQITTTARALPAGAVENRMFSTLLGGATFTSDEAREAIVTREFLDLIGESDPDSVIGRRIVVSTTAASLDSAVAAAIGRPDVELRKMMRSVRFDSLTHTEYQRTILRRELSERARKFFDGLMNRQVTVADTLVITAVGAEPESYRIRMAPIVIPDRTARKLTSAGVGLGGNPTDLFAAMQSGALFRLGGASDVKSYPWVTLDLTPQASASAVKDSVVALGFRAFSFAEQFEEIQRFFVYYFLGLGVLGLIALVTASLGIVNTMVMSITERRREIGILKSLGADEREIRLAFLVESSAIGAVGSAIGIALGWLGTRIVSAVIKIFMEREEMPVFEPFALPLWLILLSLVFGVLVSLLAGSYPARRASRVDPVEALRSE